MATNTNTLTMEEKARRKGRAYQCLRCHQRTGKETVDVRNRIEDHILKVHLSLDEVPFYCNLCMFRCTEEADLKAHVQLYRKHRLMAADCPQLENDRCLVRNPHPHIIGEGDYRILSQEESRTYWMKTMKPPKDMLMEAVDKVFPESWLTAHADDNSSVHSGQTKGSCSQQKDVAATEGQPSVVELAKQITERTKMLVEAKSTSSKSVEEWVQGIPDENILPQILGQGEEKCIEKRTGMEPPRKRPRSVSPASSSSSGSSASETGAITAAIRAEGSELRGMLREVMATNNSVLEGIREAIEGQTRAIRDLTTTILESRRSREQPRSRDDHPRHEHDRPQHDDLRTHLDRERARDNNTRTNDDRHRADDRSRSQPDSQHTDGSRKRSDDNSAHTGDDRSRNNGRRSRSRDDRQRTDDSRKRSDDNRQRKDDDRSRNNDRRSRSREDRQRHNGDTTTSRRDQDRNEKDRQRKRPLEDKENRRW